MRAKAIRQKNSPVGLDAIAVDYLQLMKSSGKVESRQQEVSDFSRSLKLLAKELNVPIIALSQLNRGSENRADKRPVISDLRESGSLEQDADIVMLIHRPEVSDPNDHPGQAELILAKNRQGSTGTIHLTSLLIFSKFAERGKYEILEEPEIDADSDIMVKSMYETGDISDLSEEALSKLISQQEPEEFEPKDEDIPEDNIPAW